MFTGTWLESEKLLPGLFFLLLLLLLLLPPELTVLPPDTFLFRRLFGACLAGSATKRWKKCLVIKSVVSRSSAEKKPSRARSYYRLWLLHSFKKKKKKHKENSACKTRHFRVTWRCYHPLPLLEKASLQTVSGA